ncbi:hypothetical protein EVJ50_03775 [Synechococcus sp. RSCCF101]|uniref:hypothetical protein n=1 Tax=Synechococcus sp. RSCCF101 TaxID=2511069 RepID=UPI0012489128|nr:hypothetical protein [Synechococcus sp. RSCCF101]QEY31498.1 hypothetical protein EVJ50_03775 [Synechococcus sp. RSCCF101]
MNALPSPGRWRRPWFLAWPQPALVACLLAVVMTLAIPQPAWSAAMGLAWGSGVVDVRQQLDCDLEIHEHSDEGVVYTGEDLHLGALPVHRLRALIAPETGLQRLVVALPPQDSSEVLAALRARYGAPVSTSHEDGSQDWMWMTQDDCIHALRIPGEDFLLTYRPVRLDLSQL